MTNQGVLTAKEEALISVSASIAAGCRPCTEHHVNSAHKAGACDRSIALAIETALRVRESATRAIANWDERCQNVRPELSAEFREQKRAMTALAALAASAAVNSVPDIEEQLETARQAGATPEQIRAALAIAASIQTTAREKAAEALAGGGRAGAPCCERAAAQPSSCGCS